MDVYDPQGLHHRFLAAFPDPAIITVGAVIVANHITAPDTGLDLYGEVGRQRCGLLRWIGIDSELLKAGPHLPKVDVSLIRNENSGGHHIELSGAEFKLLINHDRDPLVEVPKSEYGKTLAQSNEPFLFQDESIAMGKHYVAVLFHSRASQLGAVPANLEVRFPVGNEYAAEHLRLFDLFPQLMDPNWVVTHTTELFGQPLAAEETIAEPATKLRAAREVGS